MPHSFPLPSRASRLRPAPVIAVWRRAAKADLHAPLVIVLHGRGADEHDLLPVVERFPRGVSAVSLRGLVDADGGGYTWFENRGTARPVAASLRASVSTLRAWLDEIAPPPARRPCYLLGFSAGMMMAGALILDDPPRFAGAILLSGAIAFDSGIAAAPGGLRDMAVFYARGTRDTVIPRALVTQTERYLSVSGADLTVREYDLAHEISSRETVDIAAWLTDRL